MALDPRISLERQLKKDLSSWNRYWVPITELLGTADIRLPPNGLNFVDSQDVQEELRLLTRALLLIMKMMPPRSKHSKAAAARLLKNNAGARF